MDTAPDLSRRRWLKGGLTSQHHVQPLPWALDWPAFTAQCTRCGDCIQACPEQIIVVADGGFPAIDFSKGECTFCTDCVSACGEPLFYSTEQAPWQQVAAFSHACLAHQGVHCRSCEDSCEPRAIRFRPRLGGVSVPELEQDACTGCGGCVAACPVSAISIVKEGGAA
ncbi:MULTISPECIES: ferredoxin-type protein NapF [Oceanimonas]|uniref:Ferredoxin-type protein NapF n=1 Tax=Oceanimonas smirnovii TaxID=264574 RepID=A0ABW7P2F6_9GAMM|nr:ferredoxin-type protein NapF [Oceanimonas sp. CAM02]MDV2858435.1 ferredoxin-type protein NapF [Oceanimonas sp. CAM02]